MKLTPARHTALARLSDGDWHFTDTAPATAAWLYRNGLIRCNRDDVATFDRLWTITPAGLEALKEAGE